MTNKNMTNCIYELLKPFVIKNTRLEHCHVEKSKKNKNIKVHDMLPIYVLLHHLCCCKPEDAREELENLWSNGGII
jgi:hypothetical protein